MMNAKRERILLPVIVLIVIAIAVYGFLADTPPPEQAAPQIHMPTGKPLLEPDRPDLIGDPGIANEENNDDHEEIPNN